MRVSSARARVVKQAIAGREAGLICNIKKNTPMHISKIILHAREASAFDSEEEEERTKKKRERRRREEKNSKGF